MQLFCIFLQLSTCPSNYVSSSEFRVFLIEAIWCLQSLILVTNFCYFFVFYKLLFNFRKSNRVFTKEIYRKFSKLLILRINLFLVFFIMYILKIVTSKSRNTQQFVNVIGIKNDFTRTTPFLIMHLTSCCQE